ncbi:MAG: hypothetical protein CBC42_05310 [Betaproteobacteria bacterium TMED82]|nr:MAG: hypothetical protein CBC42_05310 [Betaproteobacteria bacterium TMED82]|tara:strand:- start:9348 stop:10643 length:1296 start_codon:yes stop_codon:yes gene_type:complete
MLSIITPVFNSGNYIKDIWTQVDRLSEKLPCELILVDDGSTDNSKSLIERIKPSKNVKVKSIRLDINSGPGVARNVGLSLVTYPFLTFLDSDDKIFFCSEALKQEEEKFFMMLERSVDVIALRTVINTRKSEAETSLIMNELKPKNFDYFKSQINECWGYIFRSDFIKHSGIRFLPIRLAEDQAFITEIFCSLKRFENTNAICYEHKTHGEGLATKISSASFREYILALKHVASLKTPQNERSNIVKNKIDEMRKYLIWYLYPYMQEVNSDDSLVEWLTELYKGGLEEDQKSQTNPPKILADIEALSNQLVEYLLKSKLCVYFYCLSVVSISIIETLLKNNIKVVCIFDDARSCKEGSYKGIRIEKNSFQYLKQNPVENKNILIIGHLDQKVGRNIAFRLRKRSNSFFFRMIVVDLPWRMLEFNFCVVKKQ